MNIPYGKQLIDQNDIDQVVKVLKSDFLTQGPYVAEFEKSYKGFVGAEYAIAVSNGTAALHLAALALGLESGQNIITTSITFAASANCAKFIGANVFFVDIDVKTGLLDFDKVQKLIESKPKGFFKGIIAVSFAGLPIRLKRFRKLADKYHLWIIEDACHAPGAYYQEDGAIKKSGGSNYADATMFSFHPVKHIACGEGGMITTNRKDIYDKVSILRTHGITKSPDLLSNTDGPWYYEMIELGFNYRLTDIQASLGITQLQKIDENLERRRQIAKKYVKAFDKIGLKYLKQDEGHAYHLFVILTEKRRQLYDFLRVKHIFAQVHYIPLHKMPYYKEQTTEQEKLPNAEKYYSMCLSLPMYHSLSEEEQQYVIDTVKDFFQ